MDIFGPNFPIKYRFTDICGSLTADVESVDYGGQIAIKFNPGTGIDPNTGVITFSIEYVSTSCCGLADAQKSSRAIATSSARRQSRHRIAAKAG